MSRFRRKPIAVACLALVVCVAILPGFGGVAITWSEPAWVLLPDIAIAIVPLPPSVHSEQLVSLSPALPSRAPPHTA